MSLDTDGLKNVTLIIMCLHVVADKERKSWMVISSSTNEASSNWKLYRLVKEKLFIVVCLHIYVDLLKLDVKESDNTTN